MLRHVAAEQPDEAQPHKGEARRGEEQEGKVFEGHFKRLWRASVRCGRAGGAAFYRDTRIASWA